MAIELAEISLWLNTIYEGHTIPWFGGQLAAGNSLVGARRQVFTRAQLESQNREWLGSVSAPTASVSPDASLQTRSSTPTWRTGSVVIIHSGEFRGHPLTSAASRQSSGLRERAAGARG